MQRPVSETTVQIRGATYQIRTDLGPDTLGRLADYVDEKMRELDPKSTLAPGKVSVLTSLSIAGELMEVRDREAESRRNIVSRLERLEELLDEALGDR
jgi:cell division protein ZapA (FtsZ GTPase activity inhibitor)